MPDPGKTNSHSLPKPTFTIVIPAKNEERTVGILLDAIIPKFGADKIVVIVDDQSDCSLQAAREKNIKIIFSPEGGKGAALRLAIRSIQSDILLFIDADGSHDPNEIAGLLEPLIRNHADLVIASRIKGGSEEFSGNLENRIRFLGNILGNAIINFFWAKKKTPITDAQNGFRAIRREPALQLGLKEKGFAIEQEIVIKSLKKNLRILELPSFELRRKHGKSHINPALMLPRYIKCFIDNLA